MNNVNFPNSENYMVNSDINMMDGLEESPENENTEEDSLARTKITELENEV